MKVRDVLKLIRDDGWYQVAQASREDRSRHRGRSPIAGNGQGNLRKHPQAGRFEMKEYAAVFERTSTGWSAYVPDLPGLGVAAKTRPQTEKLLRQGIQMHIAGLREDGLPIPEPQTHVMRLAIPA
jgi:predicted RNase H-like HicB family nuclease